MAKGTAKSTSSPTKSVSHSDKDTRRANDEIKSRNTNNFESEKSIKSPESATSAKSTTRKRKSSVPNTKQQQENRIGMESKTEPKSEVSSPQSTPATQSLFTKTESVRCTKTKSPHENRPSTQKSSEPSKLSPSKREANERLKSNDRSSVQSLEQEINERKAESQTTNMASGNKSKLSDALDKLVYKQKEKEQQQQQKQLQKTDKQSKRLLQSIEARKSPIDMEIEPKESNERDEIIDIVKENRTECPAQNDSKIPDVVNDIGKLGEAALSQSELSEEINQLQFGTDKYEQEQFVNNMPKPPTPKSSMIFSPPPTSLTIDKREASIFDFADNFTIPNDSAVSLLSFNPDNLFKEDSAKETMDLVANLRQNIKKGGKNDECHKPKSEPMSQTQNVETETSPDSTTTDIHLKGNVNNTTTATTTSIESTKISQSIESNAKVPLSQPTLVIDLDQENSGDESKVTKSNTQMKMKPSTNKDNNWTPNSMLMNKNRGNPMNVATITSPLQLQTEIEQIASKLSNVIPTPTDFVMCNELNDGQNINAFNNMQPYVCDAFNGNKEAFERQSQAPVVSDLTVLLLILNSYAF